MREKSVYHIHPGGGLLSNQFIEKLRQKDTKEKYAQANTFSIKGENPPSPTELEKKISDAWNSLKERWDSMSTFIKTYDISTARRRWIIPFFEALDYKPEYLKKDTLVSEEKDFKVAISHKGGDWENAPMINTVEPGQDLDERVAKGRGGKSPHDTLQIYLNETDDDLWGIVTNGILLRVLRKYYHTYTKGYIQFDLEGIFEERSFSDFLALYRMIHPSRFIPDDEGIPPLEHFFNISRAAGEKIGDDLRENVKAAIEVLGNGFLMSSGSLSNELIDQMIEDPELSKEYYQEILHIIYRIMFLMYAEQREMLPTRDSLYADAYSLTRLRERTEKTKRKDRHYDIWKGLLITFKIVGRGSDDPAMGVFGYNGSLFDDSKISRLKKLNCENTYILKAVKYLTYFESEKTLQRISYVDLGVEEIGSIYENLLDYTPRILDEDVAVEGKVYLARTFFLDPRGAARKSTGSYYTHPQLINELIQSALKPVLEDRLTGKDSVEEKEMALLSIKVCDPACGSGAFLIAATNFLGKELAKIRTGTEYPSDKEERRARREVLQHCIYGVDLNPMAADLAKVSLWIDACVKDMPLNFLDHHIKYGNSLIGTTTELMKNGIPTDAYSLSGLKGEVKELAKRIRAKNKNELKGKRRIDNGSWERIAEVKEKIKMDLMHLTEMSEKDAIEVEKKKKEYEDFIHSDDYVSERFLAHAWTSAFFWPLDEINSEDEAFTYADFQTLEQYGMNALGMEKVLKIQKLADDYSFFHWELEFLDVFSGDDPGFDCVLGNPPWEEIQPEEQKFFKPIAPDIASLSGAKRKKAIKELLNNNSKINDMWFDYLNSNKDISNMLRNSGRFVLTPIGKLNTYSLFAELTRKLLNENGITGIVVPIGIVTDHSTKLFFSDLINNQNLSCLIGFENESFIFPAVHHSFKFCALTITGKNIRKESADFTFFCRNFDHIQQKERHFNLNKSDFLLINPNTQSCPTFRTNIDAELTKKIHKHTSILINDNNEMNPWEISYSQGLFNMTTDSILFFSEPGDDLLPLYEAKMFFQFDHRYATYKDATQANLNAGILPQLSREKKIDPTITVQPRYWVNKSAVEERLKDKWEKGWLLGFRGVTSSVVERTAIFSILPRVGIGHTISLIFIKKDIKKAACLFANFNSIIFDYVTRQKTGGTYLGFYILKQLPVIGPEEYSTENINFIVPRVLELVYTAWDIKPFADELWNDADDILRNKILKRWNVNQIIDDKDEFMQNNYLINSHTKLISPFKWDENRRIHIKAELDAYFAQLYNLTKNELNYILEPEDVYGTNFIGETFRVHKEKEIKKYGEYRTKRLILDYYDQYVDKIDVGKREKGG